MIYTKVDFNDNTSQKVSYPQNNLIDLEKNQ